MDLLRGICGGLAGWSLHLCQKSWSKDEIQILEMIDFSKGSGLACKTPAKQSRGTRENFLMCSFFFFFFSWSNRQMLTGELVTFR